MAPISIAVSPEHRSAAEAWSGGGATLAWELSDDPAATLLEGRVRAALVQWSHRDRSRGTVVAVPPRLDVRDVIVPREGSSTLQGLPPGARVGLAGPRREALLGVHRPDLEFRTCRVHDPAGPGDGPAAETLLLQGAVDAVVVPAGEARARGLSDRVSQLLDPKAWMPGPGQGGVVLVVAPEDEETARALRGLDEPATRAALEAEEALARSMGFGPEGALGALALPYGQWLRLWAMLASARGRRVVRADESGPDGDPTVVAQRVAAMLRGRGSDLLPEPAPMAGGG